MIMIRQNETENDVKKVKEGHEVGWVRTWSFGVDGQDQGRASSASARESRQTAQPHHIITSARDGTFCWVKGLGPRTEDSSTHP